MEDTGGTTSNMCEISPSDLAGQVDNLISRVINLEQALSQLLGTDISAEQLSDISQDLGWVTGVTFLGTEGWTQTPSGTLIPPDGWTGLSGIIDPDAGITFYGAGGNWVDVLTRYTNYLTDIGTGATQYIHPTSGSGTPSLYTNKGDTGLTSGAVGGSKNGWISSTAEDFYVDLYVDFIEGTSAPTGGEVDITIFKTRQSVGVNTFVAHNTKTWITGRTTGGPSGGVGVHVATVAPISVSVTEGWTFRVDNNTDGDIQVSTLVATMAKL